MLHNKKLNLSLIALLLLALLIGVWSNVAAPVNAAPNAVVTPVAPIAGAGGDARLVEWWNKKSITADTRICVDLMQYRLADVEFVIDQPTSANTLTLKLQNTIDGINFFDQVTLASANSADASGMNQYGLFGRETCVFADMTNTNPVIITVVGKAMK